MWTWAFLLRFFSNFFLAGTAAGFAESTASENFIKVMGAGSNAELSREHYGLVILVAVFLALILRDIAHSTERKG